MVTSGAGPLIVYGFRRVRRSTATDALVDTNTLIEIVTLGSPMAKKLAEWLKTGEQLAASAIAWSEFLSGPVSEHQINGVKTVLADQIVQFGVAEAATAGLARYGRQSAHRTC